MNKLDEDEEVPKRFTPSTITLLKQDPDKTITPVAIRVAGYEDADTTVYTREDATDSAWLYALQAAKTSVTVYRIWLGHVYHWHIVTAAMQATMYNTLPTEHLLKVANIYHKKDVFCPKGKNRSARSEPWGTPQTTAPPPPTPPLGIGEGGFTRVFSPLYPREGLGAIPVNETAK